ncbi:MAG: biotin/lipoyl-containing protein [Candidatus Sumerlaeaceae bacterium]
MGSREIRMPKLSESMTEGKVLHWGVKKGDFVSPGDVLGEVETDKANMEIEATEPGYIEEILVPVGSVVPVGTPLLRYADKLEDLPAASCTEVVQLTEDGGSQQIGSCGISGAERGVTPFGTNNVSPVAEELARELGVDLASVSGSGPQGRIMKNDVLRAAQLHHDGSHALLGSAQPQASISLQELVGDEPAEALQSPRQQSNDLSVPPARLESITFSGRLPLTQLRAPLVTIVEQMKLTPRLTWRDLIPVLVGRAYALALHCQAISAPESFAGDAIAGSVAVSVGTPNRRLYPLLHSVASVSLATLIREFAELRERALAGLLRSEECRGAQLVVEFLGQVGGELASTQLAEGSSPLVCIAMSSSGQLRLSLAVRTPLYQLAAWSKVHTMAAAALRHPLLLADIFEPCE